MQRGKVVAHSCATSGVIMLGCLEGSIRRLQKRRKLNPYSTSKLTHLSLSIQRSLFSMSVSKESGVGIMPLSSPVSTFGLEQGNVKAPPKTSPLSSKSIRREYPVFVGEFIGTFMFLFLAFAGTQIAVVASTIEGQDSPNPDMDLIQQVSKLIYVAFAFGAGLAVNVAIFADISGGMFNPAVSHAPVCLSIHQYARLYDQLIHLGYFPYQPRRCLRVTSTQNVAHVKSKPKLTADPAPGNPLPAPHRQHTPPTRRPCHRRSARRRHLRGVRRLSCPPGPASHRIEARRQYIHPARSLLGDVPHRSTDLDHPHSTEWSYKTTDNWAGPLRGRVVWCVLYRGVFEPCQKLGTCSGVRISRISLDLLAGSRTWGGRGIRCLPGTENSGT